MPSEVTLPVLGENIEEGEVTAIKVAAGAEVTEGQPLIEVQAEKSTADVPAPFTGRIRTIRVKVGDKVKTGEVICLIDSANGKAAPPEASKPVSEPPPPTPPKSEGKTPSPEPPPSPPAATPRTASEQAPSPPQAGSASPTTTVIAAGPATRRLARELGVDLARVPGSAKGGRVTQEDVKAFVRELASGTAQPAGAPATPALPDFSRWGPVDVKPLDVIRRKTAEQMSLSWRLIPHVTQHDLADVTELESFRKQQDTKEARLTVTAFALKAAAIALRQYPQFNASVDLAGAKLIYKQYFHLGVAVDTERGLLVPVLRDVDKKSVFDLAKELVDIAERARQKKITVEDMRGGTFTITNLGGIGGTAFTPIINYPEVAILGLSRGRLTPVVKDGQIVPRLLLPLSLSYDHRVIDGADAARFTRRIVEMLENPLVMLLHA